MGIFKGLSFVFGQGVQLRNYLYDENYIKTSRLPVKVISVGNISVGGTGKTSFVIWLLRALVARGYKVGVVSRGYGGSVKSVARVPVDGDPKIFGDEPSLIARENLGPVFVGPKRFEVGERLLNEFKVDFIIADDAFQHRRLARDIDVVLVDFSEPPQNLSLMPYGRLREDFKSLRRANVIVSTKRSFSKRTDFGFIENQIPDGKIRLNMEYHLKSIVDEMGQPTGSPMDRYLLVSGVAQPQGVEILANSKCNITDHVIFDDHHSFTENDVSDILAQQSELGANLILTTQKDAVKLFQFPQLKSVLRVMELDYKVEGPLDEFFEVIARKAL